LRQYLVNNVQKVPAGTVDQRQSKLVHSAKNRYHCRVMSLFTCDFAVARWL